MKTRALVFIVIMIGFVGCTGSSKSVQKIAKPVDQTAAEIVKVREIKSQGETVAVLSPSDPKQLKIKF